MTKALVQDTGMGNNRTNKEIQGRGCRRCHMGNTIRRNERGYYTTDMESESENGIEVEMNWKLNGTEWGVTVFPH